MRVLWQDLRYGLRMLRKSPGFTATAVLTLALGIGANASIFSFVNALLIRSLNVADPQQLFWVGGKDQADISDTVSYRLYEILRDMETPFQGVSAVSSRSSALSYGDQTERIGVGLVSGEFFALLGARPERGRLFGPEDDRAPGASPVVVLGYDFWRDRFAADPDVVGRKVTLSGVPFTVIGVAQKGFTGISRESGPPVWAPITMTQQVTGFEGWNQTGWQWLTVLARLKPGATIEQGQAAADVAYRQWNEESIAAWHGITQRQAQEQLLRRAALEPAGRGYPSSVRYYSGQFGLLGAVVVSLLLIACANVASLMLARGSSRRQEIAVRLAIGAGRGRLIRQLLTESLLLAGLGSAVGLLLAAYLNAPLAQYLGLDKSSVLPDAAVLGFTLVLSVVTTLLFGLMPALRASRLSLSSWLKGTGQVSAERRHWGLRGAFVAVQVALCLPILIGAGLLLRTLANLYAVDLGFQVRQLVQGRIDPQSNGYDSAKIARIYDELLDRLRLEPGVVSAALGDSGVFSGSYSARTVYRSDETDPESSGRGPSYIYVSGNYFSTLGIRLLAGRVFDPTDTPDKPPSAVVNEEFARQFFESTDVLGRQLKFGMDAGAKERMTIVGLVADSQDREVRDKIEPVLYLSYRQRTPGAASIYVRMVGEAGAGLQILRQEVRAVDPNLPVFQLSTLEEQIDHSLRDERTMTGFLLGFGLVGLLLSAVGLYGVLAYGVTRRIRELGLRKALGARDADLVRLVIAGGARWVGLGLLIGAALALGLTRLLEHTLYGVKATDSWTYAGCAAFLALVALMAAYLPARRAARIEAMEALRYE